MAKIRRQNVPRRLQDAHKTAQEARRPLPGRAPRRIKMLPSTSNTPQDDPKTTPRRPKTPPRWPQDASKTPLRQPKSHKSKLELVFRPTQGGTPSHGPMGYLPWPSIFEVCGPILVQLLVRSFYNLNSAHVSPPPSMDPSQSATDPSQSVNLNNCSTIIDG